MNFFKKILKLGIYGILAAKVFAFNIGVAPTGFYMNLDKNETQEIMISNNTLQPMRIEIEAIPDEAWKDYSMNEWIKIYPKIVTVKPNGSRNVRFSVRKPENLPDGEYKAGIIFKELPGRPAEKQEIKGTDMSIDFELLTEIHIYAYGLKGTREVTGKLLDAQIKKDKNNSKTLVAFFESKGNSALAVVGKIEYLDAGKKVLGKAEEKIGMTTRQNKNQLSQELQNIPEKSRYVKVTFEDKSGLKLGTKELSL